MREGEIAVSAEDFDPQLARIYPALYSPFHLTSLRLAPLFPVAAPPSTLANMDHMPTGSHDIGVSKPAT